jgi:uncharacterized protein (DUF952 family)
MRVVYHLVPRSVWEAAPQPYQADSLASEGFIHCSNAEQVASSANRFFADQADLLVLQIDPTRLTSPLRDEPAGTGELFPHVYGPINPDAVLAVRSLTRGRDGQWLFVP